MWVHSFINQSPATTQGESRIRVQDVNEHWQLGETLRGGSISGECTKASGPIPPPRPSVFGADVSLLYDRREREAGVQGSDKQYWRDWDVSKGSVSVCMEIC